MESAESYTAAARESMVMAEEDVPDSFIERGVHPATYRAERLAEGQIFATLAVAAATQALADQMAAQS